MKKRNCRICAILLMAAMLFLTGCAGSFFAEEAMQIASVESELLEDGRTRVTITYTSEDVDPYVFFLPKGDDGSIGADGNGIKEIVCNHNDETYKTEVTIRFTDATLTPVTMEIPDGLSVVGIQDGYDELTESSYVVFQYSDGSISNPIYLPKGDKGNGIKSFNQTLNEDKSVSLSFAFDDGKTMDILIPAPQTGNGILSMQATEDGDHYYIDVNYTNGTTEQLKFQRPADPNQWLYGSEEPGRLKGSDGDYYFDTYHKVIYVKEKGSWTKVISFKEESETKYFTVSFDLNDAGDAKMPEEARPSYQIEKGTSFVSAGYGDIPVPTREGYRFMGWYTKKAVNHATMSPFTDLTPVFSDLTLYAQWEQE